MSLYSDIAWGRDAVLDQTGLNRRAKIVADAIEALREFVPSWQAEVNALRDVGLDRINLALLPAYEQIIGLANLGALLSASSSSSVEIGLGPKTFVLPEATRRNFAPTPFLMAAAGGDFDTSMIGVLSSYDMDTGVLVIVVERVSGEGTFGSWTIGPIATTDDLEALRDQVGEDAHTASSKADEAIDARNEAVPAAAEATNALETFQASWYGPRDSDPEGAALGAQYLDTSQSPNVVKVLTETGWDPTVTVSVGGSRQQIYTATEGQTGPFAVSGGFTFGSVNVNGAEFFDGHGVSLDAEEGEFTLSAPLTAGDLVVFRGYLANDALDIWTKAEADGRFISPKIAQAFSPEELGQAQENLGLVPTASPTDSTAGRLLKVADSPSLLAAVAALSVLGRSANSNGALGDIVAASNHQVLRRSGTTLGFGAVALDQSAAVTGLLPAANVAVHPALRVTCGGTANAVTLTSGAGISGTPVTGLQLRFRASAANTGTTTIALDGGSAIACRTVTGVALPAGYIRTDADTIATFDGTFWVLNRAEERGSNANGTFTRTETGGLLCEHRITIDEYAGTNRMGKTWTYPAAFASAPRVHVSLPMVNQDSFIGLSGGSFGGRTQIRSWGPGEFSTNSTSSQVNVWAETGTFTDGVSSITGVHLTATGPWY